MIDGSVVIRRRRIKASWWKWRQHVSDSRAVHQALDFNERLEALQRAAAAAVCSGHVKRRLMGVVAWCFGRWRVLARIGESSTFGFSQSIGLCEVMTDSI